MVICLLAIIASICATQNVFISTEKLTPFVNERIQNYVNKLFYHLYIEKHFKHYYKIEILLIMYNNLNKLIDFNWKVYSDIKNNVSVAHNFTDNIIYKVVEEALNEEKNTSINTEGKHRVDTDAHKFTDGNVRKSRKDNRAENVETIKQQNYVNFTKSSKISVTHAKDAWDNQILDKLLDKINNLTVDDFINEPINKNYLEINKGKRYKLPKRIKVNLKSWDPKEYSESFMSRRMNPTGLIEIYPFVASIHVMGKLACTGSIISKDAVITAASCLPYSYNTNMILRMPNLISVRVGTDFAEKYGEIYSVKDVQFHPQYKAKTLKNNLALVRVKLQLHSGLMIRRIRLDEGKNSMRSVQIIGFGAGSSDFNETLKKLAVSDLNVDPLVKCTRIYSRKFVTEANFCAGGVLTSRTARCNGDMGAPAVAGVHLVGVVTFGSPTCKRGPTVFTRVSGHRLWISDVIQKWNTQYSESSTSRITRQMFVSTRMYNDKFEPVSSSAKANHIRQKQKIFNEIRAILQYIKDPFSILRNVLQKNIITDYKDDTEDPFKFILDETTALPAHKHPLVNKSIVPIPNVHYSTRPETTRNPTTAFSSPDIGLPVWIPYELIEEYIKNSEELDFYIKELLSQRSIGVGRAIDGPVTKRSHSEVRKRFLWGKDYHYYPRPSDNGRFDWSGGLSLPKAGVKKFRLNVYNTRLYLSRRDNKKSKF